MSKTNISLHAELFSLLTGGILLLFQVSRLKADLGVVRSNLTMMSDMMSQLDPVTVKQADMELLEVKTITVFSAHVG